MNNKSCHWETIDLVLSSSVGGVSQTGVSLYNTAHLLSPQMLHDLNTYLHKAIPDTKLTIRKYLDVKFEYLASTVFYHRTTPSLPRSDQPGCIYGRRQWTCNVGLGSGVRLLRWEDVVRCAEVIPG